MKILFAARDKYGCGWYRVRQNIKYLKMRGHQCDETINEPPNDIISDDELKQYELLVMQDHGSQYGNNLLFRAKKLGIPVVCDADDFYQHLQPSNQGFSCWNPSTLFQFRTLVAFQNCDAMTVSTEALAREYFLYCPNIYVVPNYLDKEIWSVPIKKNDDDIIRIGWAGGQAHMVDLKMLKNVMEDLIREYDGKVKFETMGIGESDMRKIFNAQLRKDKCEKCGFEGEMKYQLGEQIQYYPSVLAANGWDIAIAPCVDNSFNKMKSDLKFKEYAHLGIPGVYSRIEPYIESVEDGKTGLLAGTYEEWKDKLKMLIEDPNLRHEIGSNARKWVQPYYIEDNISRLEEIYQEVINKNKEKQNNGIRE